MKLQDTRQMVTYELERLYGSHQMLLEELPRMKQMASLAFLAECFDDQLQDARGHSERFQKLFNQLGAERRATKDMAMVEIFAELDQFDPKMSSPAVVDAKLIDVGRKINLYQQASYGTLSDIAEQMRLPSLGQLLHDRLHETDRAAEKLLNAVPDVVFV
jgi:ferritin-like metal-binding protein YciE